MHTWQESRGTSRRALEAIVFAPQHLCSVFVHRCVCTPCYFQQYISTRQLSMSCVQLASFEKMKMFHSIAPSFKKSSRFSSQYQQNSSLSLKIKIPNFRQDFKTFIPAPLLQYLMRANLPIIPVEQSRAIWKRSRLLKVQFLHRILLFKRQIMFEERYMNVKSNQSSKQFIQL